MSAAMSTPTASNRSGPYSSVPSKSRGTTSRRSIWPGNETTFRLNEGNCKVDTSHPHARVCTRHHRPASVLRRSRRPQRAVHPVRTGVKHAPMSSTATHRAQSRAAGWTGGNFNASREPHPCPPPSQPGQDMLAAIEDGTARHMRETATIPSIPSTLTAPSP